MTGEVPVTVPTLVPTALIFIWGYYRLSRGRGGGADSARVGPSRANADADSALCHADSGHLLGPEGTPRAPLSPDSTTTGGRARRRRAGRQNRPAIHQGACVADKAEGGLKRRKPRLASPRRRSPRRARRGPAGRDLVHGLM